MIPAPTRRTDLTWRPHNTAALLALALLAAGPLAFRACARVPRPRDGQGDHDRRLALAADTIDPNTASAASLRRLPGIGAKRAAAIVACRTGPPPVAFRSAEDLRAVPGIGPGTVREIERLARWMSFHPPRD